jgi:hypothetical protein
VRGHNCFQNLTRNFRRKDGWRRRDVVVSSEDLVAGPALPGSHFGKVGV